MDTETDILLPRISNSATGRGVGGEGVAGRKKTAHCLSGGDN